MAVIPTYTSTRELNAQPLARRDPSTGINANRYVEDSASKMVVEGLAMWSDAKDFSDTLAADNSLNSSIGEVLSEAQNEPDHNKGEDYLERLKEAGKIDDIPFLNAQAKQNFSLQARNKIAKSQISINKMFRDKTIDFTRGELIRSKETSKNAYVQSGDPEVREQYLKKIMEANVKGFVNDVFLANAEVDAQGWDDLRYLQVAESNPDLALEMVKDSEMSATEKSSAFSMIEKMAKQQNIQRDIELSMAENKNIDDVMAMIDDPEVSFVEKMDSLEQAEKFGMSGRAFKAAKNLFLSTNKDKAQDYNDKVANVLRSIGQLEKGITEDSTFNNSIDYLNEIKGVKAYIMEQRAKGFMTESTQKALIEEINNVTEIEERFGLKKISKKGSLFSYGYDDAYNAFKRGFNGNEFKAGMAMRDYFYDTSDKNMKKEDKLNKISEITDRINENAREEVKQTLDVMRKGGVNEKVSDDQWLENSDFSEDDLKETMRVHNLTRKDLIKKLRQR